MTTSQSPTGFWRTSNGLAAIGLILAVLYFLLTEHRAHFIFALPWLILLLCPVMHVFMHRQHGHEEAQGSDHRPHTDGEGT